MAQAHLDRLTSIDAGFLHQEDGGAHMHIGGLGVFTGPAPTGQEFRTHIASRLHLVPRYRQKLVKMPLGSGRPVWAEDASFRIGYHVRHTALPSPGGDEQLLTLVSRIVSQRLDRTKPLWEMWLVEGLADDRFALITKTHHAMIDGVGGIDLMSALFDLSPDAEATDITPWQPAATPGAVGLLAHGAVGAVRNLTRLGLRGAQLSVRPAAAVREAASVVGSLRAVIGPIVNAAPDCVLNAPPGPHRRVEVVRTSLSDYRAVKNAFGATVNDVVLTAVAGALGRFLEARGEHVDGLALRACVPVSLRNDDTASSAGNEIAILMAPLPVHIADPVARLAEVHRSMEDVKTSGQAEGASVLASIENALPPAVLARASRLGFSSRVYNLLVTNVPGPQVPIYVLGRQLEELVPLAFLAPEHLLAIAIVSYNGQLTYGLLGDADALPDLADLADHLQDTLSELVEAAEARTQVAGRRSPPVTQSPSPSTSPPAPAKGRTATATRGAPRRGSA